MKHTLILLLMFIAGCSHQQPAQLTAIPEAAKQSVRAAVDNGHRPAVVIGLINPNGQFFYSYGIASAGQQQAVSADSQFAIGSLTKLFTAEVLSRLVAAGTLSGDTPLTTLWPESNDNRSTTLWQLATHLAALPRDIPFAALSTNDRQPLLHTLQRSSQLPAEYHYSSAGMALLALAMADARHTDFTTLLEQTVLQPLALNNTGYQPDPAKLVARHQLMTPLDRAAATVEIARGAGGLYSSARDLAALVSHKIQQANNQILNDSDQPVGWKQHQGPDFISYYHGGDGNGNQAFVAYRPDNKVGVVLLSNSSADDQLQDLALHFIDPEIALPDFEHPPARQFSAEQLAAFVGSYRLADDPDSNHFQFKARDGGLLYLETTANGEKVRQTRLYGIDDTSFRLAELPLTIQFLVAENSKADAIMTFQEQQYRLVRVE